MPPFKDDQVLIIAPGSETTCVQLGLPESFTPPRWRFRTRMFPTEKEGQWEPMRIRVKRRKLENGENGGIVKKTEQDLAQLTANSVSEPRGPQSTAPSVQPIQDIEMKDSSAPPALPDATKVTEDLSTVEEVKPDVSSEEPLSKPNLEVQATQPPAPQEAAKHEVEDYEDDPHSAEGAVYPIAEGRIVNWSCLFGLLEHIYKTLGEPFHTPVLLVGQPCWTSRDHELITQYFFENWKIPALCLMDAAVTAIYAYGVQTALVVDVGLDKCDVTAVTDYTVNEDRRGIALSGCGGRSMTKRLKQACEKYDLSEDAAEQLKRSAICEILPLGTVMPSSVQNGEITNPAAAASTGAADSGAAAKEPNGIKIGQTPRGPGAGTEVGEEGGNGEEEEDEGVLDVAAIVARDNAAELLAKREQERAAKAAARKGGAVDATKQMRLRNAEKEKAVLSYEEILPEDTASNGDGVAHSRRRKREVEIGTERFMAASPMSGMTDGILDTIAAAIHSTVLGVSDIAQRSTVWDNLIVLGNGSRVKGFVPALVSMLQARYVLSPSSATMFTSELPSNFTTPVGTNGTNTPIPGQPSTHQLHHPHGVNPLLVAATKNMMTPQQSQHLQVPGQLPQMMDPNLSQQMTGHRHNQTPSSIKTVKPPEYFPEWKDPSVAGFEEASFLGAQVAAKVVFIVDSGISKGFLTRVEYNDLGPAGIHDCAM